jgi:cell division septal protein FtsQ
VNKTKVRIRERQRRKRQRKTLIALIAAGLLLFTSGIFIANNTLEDKPDPALIEVSGQPSLRVDQELIDYGDVKLNTSLTFALELTNVGDEPLEISQDPYVEVVDGC